MHSTESSIILRQQQELEYLRLHRQTTISQLAQAFAVSQMTITRDLQMFIKKGMVVHDYGQVVWLGDLSSAAQISAANRDRIISSLAPYLHGIHQVVLNSSPITETLLAYLLAKNISVLTTELITSPTLLANPLLQMTGGSLQEDPTGYFFNGEIAINTLRRTPADLALIFATGSNQRLLTTTTLAQSIIDRTMLETAAHTAVFLADHAHQHESNFMITKTSSAFSIIH